MAIGLTMPAFAADKDACGAGLICASNPAAVADALRNAGYKSVLTKDAQGDPEIDSAASGYNFEIYFYDCENHAQCGSFQLQSSFSTDEAHTSAFANAWNHGKRLIRASVNDKKELFLRYDVSTIGGLNKKHFEDVISWWASTLGDLPAFVKEQAGGE